MDLYKYIKSLELSEVYRFCLEENKSNLPYHNSIHLENVCLFSIKGCLHYLIPNPNIKLVAAAALFHDFNHPGLKNDDDNILESIRGFLDFNSQYNFFEEEEVVTITELIKATRYPYKSDCNQLTILQQIIRDADVLQGPFCQNYINSVVFALAKELKIPFIQMLNHQYEFLKNPKFCTEWAKIEYEKIYPETMKKVELAIDLIKTKNVK